MQLLMIKLAISLVWLSAIALAQLELSDTVTGSVNLTDVGIACLGNLALFITSLLRGRLYLEMGTRDLMATLTGPKLQDINRYGVMTREFGQTSVIILSMDPSNSSIKQFMKYINNAHDVGSIMLQCAPLKDALNSRSIQIPSEGKFVIAEICPCSIPECNCNCIVFRTVKDITDLLHRRMPGTLKELPDSLCILPSLQCMRNGCHGFNQGSSEVPAVCEVLDFELKPPIQEVPEDRGAIVMASDALQDYLDQSLGGRMEEVIYRTTSLIVPRLAEVLINIVLTIWFKVDGFSSALLARRAISHYIVDSKGNGFCANSFLTSAVVKSAADNTNVCQVLRFRGVTLLSLRSLSFISGCINLICSVTWIVLAASESGNGKWYKINSIRPSKPRVVVIITVICIGLVMDFLEMFSKKIRGRKRFLLRAVIVLEICCIATASTILGALGRKGFGRWHYSALQTLVWAKWGIGCYLLGEYSPEYVHRPSRITTMHSGRGALSYSSARWIDNGIMVYSSAFLFNGVLAAVRRMQG
eukprot:PITA_02970